MKLIQRWNSAADMNGDGLITFADAWLWFKWIFFYPGDLLIRALLAGRWGLARQIEISAGSYGGVLSGAVSLAFWMLAAWGLARLLGLMKREQSMTAFVLILAVVAIAAGFGLYALGLGKR